MKQGHSSTLPLHQRLPTLYGQLGLLKGWPYKRGTIVCAYHNIKITAADLSFEQCDESKTHITSNCCMILLQSEMMSMLVVLICSKIKLTCT